MRHITFRVICTCVIGRDRLIAAIFAIVGIQFYSYMRQRWEIERSIMVTTHTVMNKTDANCPAFVRMCFVFLCFHRARPFGKQKSQFVLLSVRISAYWCVFVCVDAGTISMLCFPTMMVGDEVRHLPRKGVRVFTVIDGLSIIWVIFLLRFSNNK